MDGVLRAWGRMLKGRLPFLSVEITRECPLTCPGCYAYSSEHLGGEINLRQLGDYRGQELVDRFLALADEHAPLHVSIVGGEPLVRHRELSLILPELARRGIHTQVVTSAVRPIPDEWRAVRNLEITVSIDGLQPEHDARRGPATYQRILQHIEGFQITVHCTVTRQQSLAPGYIEEFLAFWSGQKPVRKVLMSLYTPQIGEDSPERLRPEDRSRVLAELSVLRERFPKLLLPKGMIEVYAAPPASPSECVFSKVTTCVSADLKTRITPCQLGGRPDCTQCGCVASAGLGAIGRYRLPGGLRAESVMNASLALGRSVRDLRPAS